VFLVIYWNKNRKVNEIVFKTKALYC